MFVVECDCKTFDRPYDVTDMCERCWATATFGRLVYVFNKGEENKKSTFDLVLMEKGKYDAFITESYVFICVLLCFVINCRG